jgi:hypothetical protein
VVIVFSKLALEIFRVIGREMQHFPPKRVQQGVSDRFGIEALAGGAQVTTAFPASQLQPNICILLHHECRNLSL